MKKNSILIFIILLIFSCKKKEDLSSFVNMNVKIEESNIISSIRNESLLQIIFDKSERDEKLIATKETAKKVHEISLIFNKYLEDLKSVVKKKNSTLFLDEYFFNNGKITAEGDEFLNYIENYKSSLISTVILTNPEIVGMIKNTFDIGSIEDRKGKATDWLTLNFKGFPPISSVILFSEMQSDVKNFETNFYSSILNVKLPKRRNQEFKTEKPQIAIKTNEAKNSDSAKETKAIKAKKQKDPKKSTNNNSSKTHTVVDGETLYLVANKYGLTTSQLKKYNGMTNSKLTTGQKLKLTQ